MGYAPKLGAYDSPEAAFERATLPAGIEERLQYVDWERREVMIGLVPDDVEIDYFIQNRMYFTPRFDTARLPVRYVALYEKGVGIRRYGEVKNWRLTTQGSLPGAGRTVPVAQEQVHVFDVLEWKTLAAPISVLEYGPSPIAYTNFFLLSNCSSYSELFLKNEDEYRFYVGLKRLTEKAVLEDTDEATAFEFEGIKVLLDKKAIYVVNRGKLEKQDSVWEFEKHPNRTFRHLMRYGEMVKGNSVP